MRSQLFATALDIQHNYLHDDDAARASEAYSDRLIDSDYLPLPEDDSQLSFTDRMLSDKAVFNDHVVGALGLESDAFCGQVQSKLEAITNLPVGKGRDAAYFNLGHMIAVEFKIYCTGIEAES